MAANRLRKFKTIEDTANFLNGCITGGGVNKAQGAPSNNAPGITGLVGLTLIFTSPAGGTVTFVESNNAGPSPPTGSAHAPGTNQDPYTLFFKDIKGQIETVMTGVSVRLNQDQQLVIVEKTPSAGVAITGAGTANMLLGFDSQAATVGQLYKPSAVSNSPPCWVWSDTDNGGMHEIYTWE